MSNTPRPIIIDCDPGHDDLAAILLAASSPDLHIEALTTVCGNAPLDRVTDNALRISQYYLGGVPVHAGAQTPLLHRYGFPDTFHGPTGMDSAGANYPAPTIGIRDTHAAVEIIRRVRADPGNITIVAMAAMTNLALAFSLAPDLPAMIREIVFMGGGTDGGNVTPAAEFNIWADPEAAQMVMASGVRLTMFGLNVTLHAEIFNADHRRIAAALPGNPLADTLRFYMDSYRGALPDDKGAALHDACPVAWLLDPTLFTIEPARITVETNRGDTYGETKVAAAMGGHQAVARDVDKARLREVLVDALVKAAAHTGQTHRNLEETTQ